MTDEFLLTVIECAEKIRSIGYIPSRFWKFYKTVRGEPRITQKGKIGRSLWVKEPKERPVVFTDKAQGGVGQLGRCFECGHPLHHRKFICKKCGCDNQWAIVMGLTKEDK